MLGRRASGSISMSCSNILDITPYTQALQGGLVDERRGVRAREAWASLKILRILTPRILRLHAGGSAAGGTGGGAAERARAGCAPAAGR